MVRFLAWTALAGLVLAGAASATSSTSLSAAGAPAVALPAIPAAVAFPWSGEVADNGTNTTGVSLFLGNITIPAADPDLAGYNYTVWIGAATSNCVLGEAGVSDGQGVWKFHWSFDPISAVVTPPTQGWWGHLAPGDTYQVVLNLTGADLEAQLFNVSLGHFWQGPDLAPDLVASTPNPSLSFLVGPSVCATHPISMLVGMTVGASALPGGTASRDYFVQDEAIEEGRAGPTSPVPNLWHPVFQGAPADFAPQQSWSTTSLVSVTTDHPAIVEQATTAPPADVDVGQAVGVGVVGSPRIVPGGPNVNTEAITKVEFAGYPGSGSLSFATCPASAQNGSASNPGYPGGDPGITGEYGYSTNTTPTVSDIYVSYAGGAGPAITTNMSLGLRCFTGALAAPGWLDVYGLSYLQYDLPTSSPSEPYVDALTSGPRDFLGMNAFFWNVTVNALPSLAISVAPSSTVLIGQNADLTATRSGGSPSFTYTWYLDGAVDGACTTAACSLSFGAAGSHVAWASVVDEYGYRAVSPHENLTVVAPPSATISPLAAAASVGSPISFSATAGAGTGHYTYNFSVNGSANPVQSGPSGAYAYTPVHGGAYQVWVEVNDSNHDVAVSAHANLTVAEGVAVALSPAAPVSEVGMPPVLFTASASGGAGGYTYVWNDAGLAVVGPCDRECNLSSGTPGSYHVWVVVTDSVGRVGVSPHANFSVLAPPMFSGWAGPVHVDGGSNVSYIATFAGGDPPFTYAWTFNGSAVPYCSASDVCGVVPWYDPLTPMPSLQVTATDALGAVAASTTFSLVVSEPPSVRLFPTPPPTAEVGQALLLSAIGSGGFGGLAYGFLTSTSPSAPFGVGPAGSTSWDPSVAGSLQLWAETNDSTGTRAVSAHANVSVVPALGVAITPSPTGAVAAGSTLLAAATSQGGLAPLTYTWMDDGAVVPTCSTDSCGYGWTTVGSHQIWVAVADALGVEVASPHTNVSVGPTSHAPPPPVYEVALGISPAAAGGQIAVGGTSYVSGNMAPEPAGTYSLVYTLAGTGYRFSSWATSGGISVSSASAANTTISVTANGTLTAVVVSTTSGGALGLNSTSLEVLGGLAAVLLLLILLGVAVHRANQRNTRMVPPPRRPPAGGAGSGSSAVEEPPGD